MKRSILIIGILVLLIITASVAFYFFWTKRNSHELVLYGNVDVRQVDIGFRVAGQVDALSFEEGDMVYQGDLMATLDKSPYNSQVLSAKANVESINANFLNAEVLLKRRQELVGSGGISQEELDDSQANRNVLYANLEAAKASLSVAEDNLAYTEALAPTDGIILTRIREPGTVVREADPVYTLSIISPLWIRAFVTEPQLGFVYYGMAAEVYTDTEGGKSYSGRVGFISPVAEFTPKTVETTQLRTDLVYRLRVYVDNPDNELKQGMPVTVKLKRSESQGK